MSQIYKDILIFIYLIYFTTCNKKSCFLIIYTHTNIFSTNNISRMNDRGNKTLNTMFIELEEIYFHLGSHLFPGCIFDGTSHIQLYNDALEDLPVIVLYCLNLNCSSSLRIYFKYDLTWNFRTIVIQCKNIKIIHLNWATYTK